MSSRAAIIAVVLAVAAGGLLSLEARVGEADCEAAVSTLRPEARGLRPDGCAGSHRAQQPTFRARVDAVTIPVSVKRGRVPVSDLTAADFRLTDNGVEQKLSAVPLSEVPIDLTVVMTGYLPGVRDNREAYFRGLTSASMVRQSLQSRDRLRVVRVHATIEERLIDSDGSMLAGENESTRYAGVSVNDSVFYAMARPVEPDRRHLVVVFTDGFDTFSTLDLEELLGLVSHSEAVLHVVFWANPGDGLVNGLVVAGGVATTWKGRLAEWEASQRVLTDVARRTGGLSHRATDAARDLAAIVNDFRTSYVLQYTPEGVQREGRHDVRVRIARPGRFDVRARQGYEISRE